MEATRHLTVNYQGIKTMKAKRKKEIIRHLRQLGTGVEQPLSVEVGICGELLGKYGLRVESLVPYFKTWLEFSGDIKYPVVAPSPQYSCPKYAYVLCEYKWVGKYGEARMRLCLHVANEMEKEIA